MKILCSLHFFVPTSIKYNLLLNSEREKIRRSLSFVHDGTLQRKVSQEQKQLFLETCGQLKDSNFTTEKVDFKIMAW